MENSYLLAFLFLFHFSPGGAHDTYCSSGEKLHTPRVGHDVCIICDHGTFMDEENHSFRKCKPCTGIENPDVEVLVSACDRTHDAVILCTSGFYRRRAGNIQQQDKCEICTCPIETFISDHSHTYKDCFKCEELSENNLTQAVITRPCSRTAPTLFGCKAGYFRDPTQESLQIEVPCTPCRICDRRLADCDMFHDSVCDDEDRMVPTAPTNNTSSTGTNESVDVIKQLKATFSGSIHSCLLDCMDDGFATLQASIAKSESRTRKCVSSCFHEIHNVIIVSAWLIVSVSIVVLVLLSLVIWREHKQFSSWQF